MLKDRLEEAIREITVQMHAEQDQQENGMLAAAGHPDDEPDCGPDVLLVFVWGKLSTNLVIQRLSGCLDWGNRRECCSPEKLGNGGLK